MENAKNSGQEEWTPPYISWSKIPKLIQQMESNRPPQIDRTVLTGSNQVRAQTFNALVSLGLILEDGSFTEVFDRLIGAPDDRVAHDSEAASTPLSRTDRARAHQWYRTFSWNRHSPSTGFPAAPRRKAIGFFLKAAEYAEMPMSPHFKVPPNRRKRTPRKLSGNTRHPSGGDVPSLATDQPTLASLRARYIEMLMKKADAQEDFDEPLLDRIERLLEFSADGTTKLGQQAEGGPMAGASKGL